ncbi:nuclear pore complex protein nup93 [Culex quinquefasciatus]|uniref:Nuclear pore complex protein nup93 n=1 Tax=Culex quinquefasciatus TaxID=7176 RepID=B0WI74_CULQU|nr:nuclear pore complex protein nup93 [Culex quinquefasciatus]|eukprot:XP_001848408.1 nuclear pore complex protein nup93 [Culex quinquefasciatus]
MGIFPLRAQKPNKAGAKQNRVNRSVGSLPFSIYESLFATRSSQSGQNYGTRIVTRWFLNYGQGRNDAPECPQRVGGLLHRAVDLKCPCHVLVQPGVEQVQKLTNKTYVFDGLPRVERSRCSCCKQPRSSTRASPSPAPRPMQDLTKALDAELAHVQTVGSYATQNAKILNLIGSFVGFKFANQNQNSSFISLQDGHLEASLANGLLLSARWRRRICSQGYANGRTVSRRFHRCLRGKVSQQLSEDQPQAGAKNPLAIQVLNLERQVRRLLHHRLLQHPEDAGADRPV